MVNFITFWNYIIATFPDKAVTPESFFRFTIRSHKGAVTTVSRTLNNISVSWYVYNLFSFNIVTIILINRVYFNHFISSLKKLIFQKYTHFKNKTINYM